MWGKHNTKVADRPHNHRPGIGILKIKLSKIFSKFNKEKAKVNDRPDKRLSL